MSEPTTDTLTLYMKDVRKITLLTPEREQALAEQLLSETPQTRQDARDELAASHLPLVLQLVGKRTRDYRGSFRDLISVGNEALLNCAKPFDPRTNKGFDPRKGRFSTYATPRIESAIKNFANKNPLVKIVTTNRQRKVFYNLAHEKAARDILGTHLPEAAAKEIAEKLQVPVRDVVEMNVRMNHIPISLDTDPDDIQNRILGSERDRPEAVLARRETDAHLSYTLNFSLPTALMQLDERERDILAARFPQQEDQKPMTTIALGEKYGVSSQRILQIEAAALRKLRASLIASDKAVAQNGGMQWRQTSDEMTSVGPAKTPLPGRKMSSPRRRKALTHG